MSLIIIKGVLLMQKKNVTTIELLENDVMQFFINELDSLKEEIALLKSSKVQVIDDHNNNRLFSMDEMSELIRMSKGSLYNLTYKRKIGFVKIGRTIYFTQKHFDEYIEENSRLTKKQIAIKFNTQQLSRGIRHK